MISSAHDDIPTEADTGSQLRRRRAVAKRPLVPPAGSAQCLLPVAATNAVESCWKWPSTMVCICLDEDILVAFHDCTSFLVLVGSGHFSNDPAVTLNNATGHQLVTLCRLICAEERAQFLEPLMNSNFCHRTFHVYSLVCVHLLLDYLQD